MEIYQRVLKSVVYLNWILLFAASILGFILLPLDFTKGIIFGGLITVVNFHMLFRTLKKAFAPSHLSSRSLILAKYYIRFAISVFIIFVLISRNYVDPFGLVVGLSVVVISTILVTAWELKRLVFKEAI